MTVAQEKKFGKISGRTLNHPLFRQGGCLDPEARLGSSDGPQTARAAGHRRKVKHPWVGVSGFVGADGLADVLDVRCALCGVHEITGAVTGSSVPLCNTHSNFGKSLVKCTIQRRYCALAKRAAPPQERQSF